MDVVGSNTCRGLRKGSEATMGSQQKCHMVLWLWSPAGCLFRDVPELGHLRQRVVHANYFYCPGLDVPRARNTIKGKNPGESQL